MQKIILAVTSKIPTDKAFGVTLTQTQGAILKAGNDCEIWASGEKESKIKKFVPYDLGKIYYQFFASGQASQRKSLRISVYIIHTFLVSFTISLRLKRQIYDLIVIREYLLFFLTRLFCPKQEILFEIHHVPRSPYLLLAKVLPFGHKTQIGTISKYLAGQLEHRFSDFPIHILSMASPDYFRESAKNELKIKNSILYYGKMSSSGFDNGVLKFLSDLDRFPGIQAGTVVGIIGVSLTEQETINRNFTPRNFSIIYNEHISHDKIPGLISSYSVGVIPYPNLKYHNERFPIKAVELASMGIPILCSDIPGLRCTLPQELIQWYSVEDPESLYRGINKLMSEDNIHRLNREADLRSWADKYTYNVRAEKLIEIARRGHQSV